MLKTNLIATTTAIPDMIETALIDFVAAGNPITDLVTKFGGQPVWYAEPEWPISAETRGPMQFICQIKMEERLFGPTIARMAYVFMGMGDPGGTCDADSGENAVILQPGNQLVPCEALTNGPTLFNTERRHEQKKAWFGVRDEHFDVRVPCEFGVKLTYQQEIELDELNGLHEAAADEYDEASASAGKSHIATYSEISSQLDKSKLGGTPVFVQSEEWPFSAPSPLLLQLKWDDIPFELDLGDAGTLYAFLSNDGSLGKMLWQCS